MDPRRPTRNLTPPRPPAPGAPGPGAPGPGARTPAILELWLAFRGLSSYLLQP